VIDRAFGCAGQLTFITHGKPFQLSFTTLFGSYASYLFLRTGSVLPPIIVHAFCNWMGLPPVVWALQVWPEKRASILGTYVAGIALFVYGLSPWTEPSLFGGSLYWT